MWVRGRVTAGKRGGVNQLTGARGRRFTNCTSRCSLNLAALVTSRPQGAYHVTWRAALVSPRVPAHLPPRSQSGYMATAAGSGLAHRRQTRSVLLQHLYRTRSPLHMKLPRAVF